MWNTEVRFSYTVYKYKYEVKQISTLNLVNLIEFENRELEMKN